MVWVVSLLSVTGCTFFEFDVRVEDDSILRLHECGLTRLQGQGPAPLPLDVLRLSCVIELDGRGLVRDLLDEDAIALADGEPIEHEDARWHVESGGDLGGDDMQGARLLAVEVELLLLEPLW